MFIKILKYITLEAPEVLALILSTGAGCITALLSILKGAKDKRIKAKAEHIAEVVESAYDGQGADTKKQAFIDLCKKEKINIKKAVEYLENNIIPITKAINNYRFEEKKEDNEEGVA